MTKSFARIFLNDYFVHEQENWYCDILKIKSLSNKSYPLKQYGMFMSFPQCINLEFPDSFS